MNPTQIRLLRFICHYYNDKQRSPSYREMMTSCDISSLSIVTYHLGKLEDSGYVTRETGNARSVKPTARAYEKLGIPNKSTELLEALTDMVMQHCQADDGLIADWALSANENAIDILEQAGVLEEVKPERWKLVKA